MADTNAERDPVVMRHWETGLRVMFSLGVVLLAVLLGFNNPYWLLALAAAFFAVAQVPQSLWGNVVGWQWLAGGIIVVYLVLVAGVATVLAAPPHFATVVLIVAAVAFAGYRAGTLTRVAPAAVIGLAIAAWALTELLTISLVNSAIGGIFSGFLQGVFLLIGILVILLLAGYVIRGVAAVAAMPAMTRWFVVVYGVLVAAYSWVKISGFYATGADHGCKTTASIRDACTGNTAYQPPISPTGRAAVDAIIVVAAAGFFGFLIYSAWRTRQEENEETVVRRAGATIPDRRQVLIDRMADDYEAGRCDEMFENVSLAHGDVERFQSAYLRSIGTSQKRLDDLGITIADIQTAVANRRVGARQNLSHYLTVAVDDLLAGRRVLTADRSRFLAPWLRRAGLAGETADELEDFGLTPDAVRRALYQRFEQAFVEGFRRGEYPVVNTGAPVTTDPMFDTGILANIDGIDPSLFDLAEPEITPIVVLYHVRQPATDEERQDALEKLYAQDALELSGTSFDPRKIAVAELTEREVERLFGADAAERLREYGHEAYLQDLQQLQDEHHNDRANVEALVVPRHSGTGLQWGPRYTSPDADEQKIKKYGISPDDLIYFAPPA
jgi:uncharacterized protein YjiS (DUF1127 family)